MANPAALLVLGLDPGTICTGYGLVQTGDQGRGQVLLAAGAIRPPAKARLEERLLYIHQSVKSLMERFNPHEVAVEEVFTAHNAKSALILGHARGALLLAVAQAGLPLFSYAPTAVKKALVGAGRADKNQVRVMVSHLLKTRLSAECPLDASDALALALCHLHIRNLKLPSLAQPKRRMPGRVPARAALLSS